MSLEIHATRRNNEAEVAKGSISFKRASIKLVNSASRGDNDTFTRTKSISPGSQNILQRKQATPSIHPTNTVSDSRKDVLGSSSSYYNRSQVKVNFKNRRRKPDTKGDNSNDIRQSSVPWFKRKPELVPIRIQTSREFEFGKTPKRTPKTLGIFPSEKTSKPHLLDSLSTRKPCKTCKTTSPDGTPKAVPYPVTFKNTKGPSSCLKPPLNPINNIVSLQFIKQISSLKHKKQPTLTKKLSTINITKNGISLLS